MLAPPAFLGIFGFCFFVRLLPAVPDGALFFLCSLVFGFPHAAVRPALLVFLSDSRSFVSLPVLYGLRPSFSASCASGGSSPMSLLLFSSVLQFLLGNPSVVRLLLLCVSDGFLSYSFHHLLLVLVVVFFAPALVLSPTGLPCSVAVAYGCLFSDSFESPVPVATRSPFGTSQDDSGLCFSWFELPAFASILSVLSLLRSSALFASGILFVSSRGVPFSLVLSLVRCWFFPEPFLVPTRCGSFRPFSSACPFLALRFP